MDWIFQFQLFLFDFDGILVNTEELHYRAYQKMCAQRGFTFDWDWRRYARAAMFEEGGLKKAIYEAFPALHKLEPRWEILYQEKKKAYQDLLQGGNVQLMPGVERLLTALNQSDIKRCVVTLSTREQVQMIRKQLPLLDTIPFWIAREDYSLPKPHPECYETALSRYATAKERAIGFEDSPKGLRALVQTKAQGILISSLFKKEDVQPFVIEPFAQFPTFEHLCAIKDPVLEGC